MNMEKLVEQFDKFESELKAALDRQDEEIRNNGASSSATAKQVATLGDTVTEMATELKERQAKLSAQMRELENVVAQPRGARTTKTPGQRFIESAQYRQAVENNLPRSDRFEFEGSFFAGRARMDLSTTPAEGGALIDPQRVAGIISAPERQMTIRDLLDVQPTVSGSIEYVEETGFTNAADTVAEKASKPESDIDFALRTAPVQTIAHHVIATRQILADATQLRAHVDTRLAYGVQVAEEAQLIYGSGVSPDLQGIATHASVQTYVQGTDDAAETKIDAIRRGILRARRAEYPVTGIVLHPDDWAAIELTKDNDGRYIWVQVPEGGVMRLWRVPITDTTAIDVGDALLGAYSLGATLWDREQSAIRLSEHHGTVFLTNQVVILGEERVALTIYRPEAFVLVTLDSASI